MSGKNASKAKKTKEQASDKNTPATTTSPSCTPKHFFKIKVEDKDGTPVPSAQPRIELNDGTVIDPAGLDGQGRYDTGKVLDSAAPCQVSFPNIWDSDWWPEGSPPSGFSVNQQITIADGDCVVKAAHDKGFRDYLTIWNRSKNNTLKQRHPNPNALVTGDILWAPDQKTKQVSKAADQEWKFILDVVKPCKLRMKLVDKEENPLNGWDWELTAPVAKTGKTGADGLVEVPELDPSVVAGAVKVTIKKPPPQGPPPPSGSVPSPPPYPPEIKPADFKDEDPVKPPESDKVEFTLKIGSLPSHKEKAGVLGRLCNLGYNCDLDSPDPKLTAVVKSYQKVVLKQANPTGNQTDIQQTVEDRHSNP